jgi:hypothetical protein
MTKSRYVQQHKRGFATSLARPRSCAPTCTHGNSPFFVPPRTCPLTATIAPGRPAQAIPPPPLAPSPRQPPLTQPQLAPCATPSCATAIAPTATGKLGKLDHLAPPRPQRPLSLRQRVKVRALAPVPRHPLLTFHPFTPSPLLPFSPSHLLTFSPFTPTTPHPPLVPRSFITAFPFPSPGIHPWFFYTTHGLGWLEQPSSKRSSATPGRRSCSRR